VAEIYVQPGESHLVRGRVILRTVLGSCVGVTFWHRTRQIAGLCHPMLPAPPREKQGKLSLEAARRYVDFAIRDLARQLDGLGVARRETEVKLFGGADVLAASEGRGNRPTVGRQNADKVLEELGYRVIAQRLGGRHGCHIDFHTGTGEVILRRLGE
jgi:chemotaxis protein CheD